MERPLLRGRPPENEHCLYAVPTFLVRNEATPRLRASATKNATNLPQALITARETLVAFFENEMLSVSLATPDECET